MKPILGTLGGMQKIIHVALAADENYSYGAMVLLSSMNKYHPKEVKVKIHIGYFPGDISAQTLNFFERLCDDFGFESWFHEVDQSVSFRQNHISRTTMVRFFFFENLDFPFIWLDVDIAVSAGWEGLFQFLELKDGNDFVVAENANGSHAKFNAGVIGRKTYTKISIEGWQEMIIDQGLNDQDILRLSLVGRLTFAPDIYNQTEWWGKQNYLLKSDGSIFHFVGAIKPWHLKLPLRSACNDAQCAWALWYSSERHLWELWNSGEERDFLEKQQFDNQRTTPKNGNPIAKAILRLGIFLGPDSLPSLRKALRNPAISNIFRKLGFDVTNMHPFH